MGVMPDPQDKVDFSWRPAPPGEAERTMPPGPVGRPWLSIYFECCRAYARIYRAPHGRCYQGRCPRCGARLEVPIGPGGTTQRSFFAG